MRPSQCSRAPATPRVSYSSRHHTAFLSPLTQIVVPRAWVCTTPSARRTADRRVLRGGGGHSMVMQITRVQGACRLSIPHMPSLCNSPLRADHVSLSGTSLVITS